MTIDAGQRRPIDFAILTALREEREAVCATFGLKDEDREPIATRTYWRGRLPLPNGEAYEIVVANSLDMASPSAALLTNDVIHDWKPAAALFVGIAAKTSDDVDCGDIVVGTIIYYLRGKRTADGLLPEPETTRADARLLDRIGALPKWTEELPVPRPDGISRMPKIAAGPITSVDDVVADKELRDRVSGWHRKNLAMEMEGHGFGKAISEAGQHVRHIMIKAIQDDATAGKKDDWRRYACAAAAGFVRHFLLDRPIDPVSGSDRQSKSEPSPPLRPRPKPGKVPGGRFEPPAGWIELTLDELDRERGKSNPDEVLGFFDGRVPMWRHALDPRIPRREVVGELVAELREARERSEIGVWLLMGAAGEGKSTALRQVVCDIVQTSGENWRVLWHHDPDAPIPAGFRLPVGPTAWLIVSDDAEAVAHNAFQLVKTSYEQGINKLHLLLGARQTDWRSCKADQLRWQQYAHYRAIQLQGLSSNDASAVVRAWGALGKRGLGELAETDERVAVESLLRAAREESQTPNGAFLGAMLRLRYGTTLRERVRMILDKLKSCPVRDCQSVADLRQAFAYIAVPHAENVLTLSAPILEEAFGCTASVLRSEILYPLGSETVVDRAGPYILTRHRAIAEAACEFLRDEFDVSETLANLVRAVVRVKKQDRWLPEVRDWRFLSSRYYENGDHVMALRLARAAYEEDPNNLHYANTLAQLLRRDKKPSEAADVCRKAFRRESADRAFLREWAACEGNAKRPGLDACLAAFSLSDQVARTFAYEDAPLGLNGLSQAFHVLADRRSDLSRSFLRACAAASELGLVREFNSRTTQAFQDRLDHCRRLGFNRVGLSPAMHNLLEGIMEVWKQVEEPLPESVPTASTLTFQELNRALTSA